MFWAQEELNKSSVFEHVKPVKDCPNVVQEREARKHNKYLTVIYITIYVNDLLNVPKRCISASYVDDCKLYMSFSPAELSTSISALNEDLMRISQWCCKHSLLINPVKTKVLAVGVPQFLQKLSSFSIRLLDKEITPVPVVKDLVVHLDACLSYNEHITKTVSNCLLKLKQINRIKHLLDRKTLLLVMNSFVFSKLLYCSTVWSNTSNSNIAKLQKVQNFAGRIILGLRKYDHISDGLRSLNWLPIKERLILNDATMMHKCINKLVPLQTILSICLNYVPMSIIDKIDHLVPWIYLYAACQQDSTLLPTEEQNSGTLWIVTLSL